MCGLQKVASVVALVLIIIVYLDAVTVNPSLCPTNKIAPHRSAASLREDREGRTLGLILGLNNHNNHNRPRPPYYSNNVNNLQEQPQEDDPDDCGDIDDYDETDLSSITRPTQNYVYNKRGHRQIVDGSYNPTNYQDRIGHRPYRPQRPAQPHRPAQPQYYPPRPQNPGGQYGFHRPPYPNRPSGPYKPVHENTYEEPQETYRPGLIGGVQGQVVGFPPVIPTVSSDRFKNPNRYNRYPENDSYHKRNPRDRQPNVASDIIGSFVDLLFN